MAAPGGGGAYSWVITIARMFRILPLTKSDEVNPCTIGQFLFDDILAIREARTD